MNWEKIKVKQYYEIVEILTEENDPYALNAELIRCIWGVNVEDIPYVRLHQYCKEMQDEVIQENNVLSIVRKMKEA